MIEKNDHRNGNEEDPGNNEKRPQSEEELRMENELKKIKLELEEGANFFYPQGESNLPPEIESEFLDYITNFEQRHKEAGKISIYDFIGKPEYRKPDQIPDEEIAAELDKLLETMHSHNVILDSICEVDDRTLYKFITEELFIYETDNIRMKGMMTHFIYEEFHPNHEHDIRSHSKDFIETFLKKVSDYYPTFLSGNEETKKFLENFRNAYRSFELHDFEITSLDFNLENEKGNVKFKTSFTGFLEDSSEKQVFAGEGEFEMLYRYDFWCMDKVKFPEPV